MIKVENFAAIVVLLIVTTVPMVLMVPSGAAHQQLDPAVAAGAEAGMPHFDSHSQKTAFFMMFPLFGTARNLVILMF